MKLLVNIERWVLAWLLILPWTAFSQSYRPLGYWCFEQPQTQLDHSGNGHHLNPFFSQMGQGTGSAIVGGYFTVPNSPFQPQTFANVDDSAKADTEISVEFWFRNSTLFSSGYTNWYGKSEMKLSESGIEWHVYTKGAGAAGDRMINLSFTGTGLADPHNVWDNDWHHFVGTFSCRTGEQRIYIDGQSPAGFVVYHGPSAPMSNAGAVLFSSNIIGERMRGDIDEYAVYDKAIPAALVWQHYQQGLAGQHYTFDITMAAPAFPTPSSQSELNPLEFGPGYPNIALSATDLINSYPMPRYKPGTNMRRNIPWIADPENLGMGSVPQSLHDGVGVLKSLAHDWNFYLHCGVTRGMHDYLLANLGNSSVMGYHYLNLMNDPDNVGLPRFIINNWGNVWPCHLDPSLPTPPFVANDSLPDSWYICDASGKPKMGFGHTYRLNFAMANPNYNHDSRLDSLAYDGLTVQYYLQTLFNHTQVDYMDMVGENDEQQNVYEWDFIKDDPEILQDMAQNGYATGPHGDFMAYQAERLTRLRCQMRDSFLVWLDGVNQSTFSGNLRSAENWWYELKGNKERLYPLMRDILVFRDGVSRAGPQFYPQGPSNWLIGGGAVPGMNVLVNSVRYQLAAGDSAFIPAVSPGFVHQPTFYVRDEQQIRPGQFLGILKGLHLMGADAFNLFDYSGTLPHDPGNYRVWKPTMLAYAQAVGSREKDLLDNGKVLIGDTAMTQFGSSSTFYTISTGNNQDLVVGRQSHSGQRFMLTGSIQRSTNQVSQAPKQKNITIRLRENNGNVVYPELKFEIRAQGSTYVLDNSVVPPVWYQLDHWHEWKDPWHWCRDFMFEAEVWDSSNYAVTRRTERPAGAAAGDFREFTTYNEMRNAGERVEYRFRPRHDDQDSLYLWIRARAAHGSQPVLQASVDNGPVQTLRLSNPEWSWIGRDNANQAVFFGPFNEEWHTLSLTLASGEADLDVVALKRSAIEFSTAPFAASINASASTTCVNDDIQFSATGALGSDCLDYVWEFGDGSRSYSRATSYSYPYPGNYTVVVAVTNTCNDSTVYDSIQVQIAAPHVDAGPDLVVCRNDTIELQASATGSVEWTQSSTLSATNIVNPKAFPSVPSWYKVKSDSSGCVMYDSVRVTPVGATITYVDTVYGCPGQQVQLNVSGGFYYQWDAHPTLSDTTIPNPVVTIAQSMDYPFRAIDACYCDTIYGVVHVFVPSAVTADTTVCHGSPVTLQAVAGDSYLWSNGTTTSDNTVQPTSSQWYSVTISRAGCSMVDSIWVGVDSFPLSDVAISPNATLCHGDSLLLDGMPGASSYAWSPAALFANDSIEDAQSGVILGDTRFTVIASNLSGCLAHDTVYVSVDSFAFDTAIFSPASTVCHGNPVSLDGLTGASSYAWSPAALLVQANVEDPQTLPLSSSTVFTLNASNANGCQVQGQVLVSVDSFPLADVIPATQSTLCIGDSLQLDAVSGAASYDWSPAALFSTPNIEDPYTLPLVSGATASLIAINNSGCVAIDSLSIVVDSFPLMNAAISTNDSLCYGDSLLLDAMPGAVSYAWAPAAMFSNPNTEDAQSGAVLAHTTFTVSASNVNGCIAQGTVAVSVDSFAFATAVNTPDYTVCHGSSMPMDGLSGASSYAWSPAALFTQPNMEDPQTLPLSSTTLFTLDASNANGCQVQGQVLITVDSFPLADVIPASQSTLCIGDSLQLDGISGAASYAWSPAAVFYAPNTEDPYMLPLVSNALVSLTAISPNGCSAYDTMHVVVDSFPLIDLAISPDDTICYGDSLQLDALAGATGYNWLPYGLYVAPNVEDAQTFALKSSVALTVSASNGNGCVAEGKVLITVDSMAIQDAILTPDSNLCYGDSIQLDGIAGAASYDWTPAGIFSQSNVEDPQVNGITQSVCVILTTTSSDGCINTDKVFITVDSLPLVEAILSPDDTICHGESVTLDGAAGAYNYVWTPQALFGNPFVENPQTVGLTGLVAVTLEISNAHGCHTDESVILSVDSFPLTNAVALAADTICYGDSLQLDGVSGADFYTWSNPMLFNSSAIEDPIAGGISSSMALTLKISNLRNCVAFDTLHVTVDSMPIANAILSPNQTLCNGATLQLDGIAGASSYAWAPAALLNSGSIEDPSISNLSQGVNLSLTASSAFGCTVTDSISIGVSNIALTTMAYANDSVICLGDATTLHASGPAQGVLYTWSPATSLSNPHAPVVLASPGQSTAYMLTVVDSATGCIGRDTVWVMVDNMAQNFSVTPHDATICNGDSVLVHANLVNSSDSLLWSNGGTGGSIFFGPSSSDSLIATAYSSNGCMALDTAFIQVDVACCVVPGVVQLSNVHTSNWGLTTSNSSFHILDTLHVDAPISFTNCNFYLNAGAVIFVTGSATLSSTGCVFQSACGDAMWVGVQLNTSTSRMISQQDRFKDAEQAVWSQSAAAFHLQGSIFEHCWRGVLVDSAASIQHPGYFAGNTFRGGNLIAPHAGSLPEAGIVIRMVDSIQVGDPAGLPNHFSGLRRGIFAQNSRVSVDNNRFENQGPAAPGQSYEAAISSQGHAVGGTTRASIQVGEKAANTFKHWTYGVHASRPQDASIQGNDFQSLQGAGVFARFLSGGEMKIAGNTFGDCQIGIQVADAANVAGEVSRNSITGSPNALRHGMRLDFVTQSAAGNFLVTDNAVKLRGNGFWIVSSNGIALKRNDVQLYASLLPPTGSSYNGVYVAASHRISVRENQLRADMVADTNLRGVFISSSPETDLSCNHITNMGRAVTWQGSSQPSRMFGNVMQEGIDGIVLRDLANIGPQGVVVNGATVPSDNRWQGQFTHAKGYSFSSYASQSPFLVRPSTPFNPNANALRMAGTPQEHMVFNTVSNLAMASSGCAEYPQDLKGAVKGISTNRLMGGALHEVAQADADAWAYATLQAHPEWLGEAETRQANDVLESTLGAQGSALRVALAERDTVGALMAAASLDAESAWGSNLREVQSAWSALADDARLTASSDLARLQALAAECPLVGGAGVYIARALLSAQGLPYWEGGDCSGSSVNLGAEAGSGADVEWMSLWPNPTSGNVSLNVRTTAPQLEVYAVDGLGRIVYSRVVSSQEALEIDATKWEAGVYMVKVETGHSTLHGRLVVVH